MFIKIFFLTFILITMASMALAFAMMKNKKKESCQHESTGKDSCGICEISGACAAHGEA